MGYKCNETPALDSAQVFLYVGGHRCWSTNISIAMIVLGKKLLFALPILVILLALLLFAVQSCRAKCDSDCKDNVEKPLSNQPPDIVSILFDDEIVKNQFHGWVELKHKVKIRVRLTGPATTVELYITPTGTSTYKEQRLIDIAYPKNGVAEYVWDVPDSTMGHFWVVAYNKDVGRKSFLINVIRQ